MWAARLFKTRNLAAEAINGGKVHVDGQRVKPARLIRPGAEVRVRKGSFEISFVVLGVAKQRRPASEAALLYAETEESRAKREVSAELRRQSALQQPHGRGRPTKRDRRQMERLATRNE